MSDDGARVTLADVRAARDRVAPFVRRTPLLRSRTLSERAGVELWLKLESLQETGSFKPRGALNALLSLSPEERARGVVAASAGNHALGVAHAARAAGVERADLFVQANASPAKLEKIRRYPVRLQLVGETFEEAQQAALAHAGRTGAVYLSPYDDVRVIAGHGTVALELLEDLPELEAVVVPVGGGALVAGIAVVLKALRPEVRVVGVNPEASPSALISFREGRAIDPYDHAPSRAHGIAGGFGRVPFAVSRGLIDDIVLASEAAMERAILALLDAESLIAEPSGAAALAVVLERGAGVSGRVAVVVSGGNLDAATLRELLDTRLRP